ncbi:MAG: PQQ-binding-like beta-propeller repeat protein [Candidatus Binatia bacterium]
MFRHRNRPLLASTWAGVAMLFLLRASVLADLPAASSNTSKQVSGLALFESRCQLCHGPSRRASDQEALSKLGAQSIYETITSGSMKDQAAGLTEAERRAIAESLGGLEKTAATPAAPKCAGTVPAFPGRDEETAWGGWSPDLENTRFQSTSKAGLTAEEVTRLEPRWTLVLPNTASLANQVTVTGNWLFLAGRDGTIYALDRQTGCAHWTYKAETLVRTALVIEGKSIYFGDGSGTVYSLDGSTGTLRWKRKADEHPNARITGAPTAYDGVLYVGVSSHEESAAAAPSYVCCTFRGSLVAMDLATGKQVWKTYTIDKAARKQGANERGVERRGPSGAPIWSAPTVDTKRGLIYVGTGNNYSDPVTSTADAVLAFDRRTGALRWHRPLTPSDAFNAACVLTGSANCPESKGDDVDIGASPVLVRRAGGPDILLVGQKSGVLYALDPQRRGKLLWERRLGKGGMTGGILWGLATDGQRAYAAIQDLDLPNNRADGSINAVDVATGTLLWRTANPPDACKDRPKGCFTGMTAPITAMPGVVFEGSLDGHLRAFNAETGSVMWDFDAVRDFTGLNGMVGRGGSISYAGVTLAHGFAYQTTGYSSFGSGMAGNVFIAFTPAKR